MGRIRSAPAASDRPARGRARARARRLARNGVPAHPASAEPPAPSTAGSRAAAARTPFPSARGVTVHEPPCAFATASTIARPSPTPPVVLLRAIVATREPVEDPIERLGRDARARVGDLDHEPEVEHARAHLDRVVRLGVLDGILEQRVERDAQSLLVRAHACRQRAARAARRAAPPRSSERTPPRGTRPPRSRPARGIAAARPLRAGADARSSARCARARRRRPRALGCRLPGGDAGRGDRARSSPVFAARARRRAGTAPAARRAPRRRASAACRRRACHTIARNIADISGTSKSSPQSWIPSNASTKIEAPVATKTAPSTSAVTFGSQTRKP